MTSLADFLHAMTIRGDLFERLPENSVRCLACGHRCLIREGRRGICQVRYNQDGELFVPWGYVASIQVDPIEKKPFYHFLVGSDALSFGMLGCDFHCEYCQNFFTSQAMRDPVSNGAISLVKRITPEQIVSLAVRSGAEIIASTYNEPLITTEWAVSIFRLSVQEGIKNVYVSNGNTTPEVLAYLKPYLAGYKIDLKTMQDRQYRQLGGVLTNILDSIRWVYEAGLWVEVVTLVVPGFNDSTEELMDAARYIRSVSANIPWHVTAFHPDYKMSGPPRTPAKTLLRAAEIGQEAGLNYVYARNIPAQVGEYENTYCHNCRTCLIERFGYMITKYEITREGRCPICNTSIPGIWSLNPDSVRLHGSGTPRPI